MKLICYGCGNKFKPELFKPPRYDGHIKPQGGLWTSPVGSKHSWKKASEDMGIGDRSTSFTLSYTGKTAIINSPKDLLKFPRADSILPAETFFCFNIASLLEDGINAIYLTALGERTTRFSKPGLYGWDCETVFVMDKKTLKTTPTLKCAQ